MIKSAGALFDAIGEKIAGQFSRMSMRAEPLLLEAYVSGGYTLKEIGNYLGLSYSRVSRIAKARPDPESHKPRCMGLAY